MPAALEFPFVFRNVHAAGDDLAFVVGATEVADRQLLSVSHVFQWKGAWSSRAFRGDAIDVCTVSEPSLTVLMADVAGVVHAWTATGIGIEVIDDSEDGPNTLGPLREIREIHGAAYVVGMGRTVYRREGPGRWSRIDEGVRIGELEEDEEDDEIEMAGLNSIDGFSHDEIYAVGWDGEIWRYNGHEWMGVQSPTNLALQTVLCTPSGLVYAAGNAGVVLRGRDDRWELVPEATEAGETFWDAAWFLGDLYLATTTAVWRLVGGAVERVEVVTGKATYGALSAREGVLWSVGARMAAYTRDGVSWTETPYV